MNILRLTLLSQLACLLCNTALLLNATTCGAMSSMYEAQVIDKDGVPCFTVREDHQINAPRLASIYVSDESPMGHEMWRQFSIELDRVPILFGPSFCLMYGTKLENTGEFAKPAKLEIGKPYVVGISAFVGKAEHPQNRRYQAHFCLSRTENGSTKVHQIFYNKGWHYDVCATPQIKK